MRVKVVYYGGLQRDVGAKEQELQFSQNSLAVSELREQLAERYPELRTKLQSVVFAVSDEIVDEDHPVRDGDEVALLPPVSGG
jgi:molybdopterin converting factor subunit 1